MRTTQRKMFQLRDLNEGIEWATPLGKITFTEKEHNVFAVTINGTLWGIYSGKKKTLAFVNKKLLEARKLYGNLISHK